MGKIDADANGVVVTVLRKTWDLRVRSVKLYRIGKPGVDLNRTMNRITGLLLSLTSRTDILQALRVYHESVSP